MSRFFVVPIVVVAAAFGSVACASAPAKPRPSREALVAVDGTASFAAPIERVRAASGEALRGLGYDVVADDAEQPAQLDVVVRTRPRAEKVSRWRFIETRHATAVAVATVAAGVVTSGSIPITTQAGGGDMIEIDVDYTLALGPAPDDAGSTVVVLAPHAVTRDGTDCTDRYLAVLDDDVHREWSAIFDGIDAALRADQRE